MGGLGHSVTWPLVDGSEDGHGLSNTEYSCGAWHSDAHTASSFIGPSFASRAAHARSPKREPYTHDPTSHNEMSASHLPRGSRLQRTLEAGPCPLAQSCTF